MQSNFHKMKSMLFCCALLCFLILIESSFYLIDSLSEITRLLLCGGSCCNCFLFSSTKKKIPGEFFLDRSKRNLERKRELFTGAKNMTIVAPSEWLASLAAESFLGRYPIHVVCNGIDLEAFKSTNSGFA